MTNLGDLGKIIAEQTQKATMEGMTLWERVLRLHVKPRPKWCPVPLWKKVVNLVLIQSEQEVK